MVFLTCGSAFEAFGDGLKGGLILGVEGVVERACGSAVALVDKLKHGDSGHHAGGDQLFEGPAFGEPQRLDVEALGFQGAERSEEHTSELQSLLRISYAVFCLTKKTQH